MLHWPHLGVAKSRRTEESPARLHGRAKRIPVSDALHPSGHASDGYERIGHEEVLQRNGLFNICAALRNSVRPTDERRRLFKSQASLIRGVVGTHHVASHQAFHSIAILASQKKRWIFSPTWEPNSRSFVPSRLAA